MEDFGVYMEVSIKFFAREEFIAYLNVTFKAALGVGFFFIAGQ